ncbi:DUF4136 domain-containing protein [Thiosulfativibrio zosterae]|uniref:DUF4136 domain-containing protein n=1 Tax=Thiosulfativibrio zosterae TaxID=2675053 RepID=A0A6F8PPL3_9GAMM|nr:DUF4136 domain-containing protein [Thiosulfativibrio zosterae]BBP43984.1 hypothetical protein THMIRHAT_17300 [Thiosulfativibrio zosterae]
MKLNFLYPALILSALTLTGCSQIPVNQDYDSKATFTALTQFQWLPENQQVEPTAKSFATQNPLLAKRIENAIIQEIQAKGLTFSTESANAYVTYHVSSQSKLRTVPASTTIGFGIGSWGRYGGIGFQSGQDIQEYDEGKIQIDILDSNGQLMWRGISPTRIVEQSSPEKTTEFINEVVKKILAQFPPQKS